jgi:hypothetical protein
VDLAGGQVHVDAVERHRRAEALAKSREGEHWQAPASSGSDRPAARSAA